MLSGKQEKWKSVAAGSAILTQCMSVRMGRKMATALPHLHTL